MAIKVVADGKVHGFCNSEELCLYRNSSKYDRGCQVFFIENSNIFYTLTTT